MAAVSVLLVAVLVIMLFCGALFRVEIASLVIVLFVGCMLSLIGSLGLFIWDVNLSLKALWLDFPVSRRGTAGLRLQESFGKIPAARKTAVGR
jgi:hypothetical protein